MTFTVSRKLLYVLGGIAVLVIAGVVGALIGGGGDDKTTTVTVVESVGSEGSVSSEESTSEEGEEETEVETPEGDEECVEKGITADVGNEGTCTEEGFTSVVVNKGSTLKLRELNAKLLNTETAKTVSGEYGDTKTANGIYVIFDLEITNKTHSPTYFDSNQEQVFLQLGENEYTEDFDVENYVLDTSFVNTFEKLQPQTAVSGTVAFDVPAKLVPDLHKTANLDILNFSDGLAPEEAKVIGVIRTYQ